MRIPQAADNLKEAPAQVLRAVFAGVGQLLLLTERARRHVTAQLSGSAAPAAGTATSSSSSAVAAPEPAAPEPAAPEPAAPEPNGPSVSSGEHQWSIGTTAPSAAPATGQSIGTAAAPATGQDTATAAASASGRAGDADMTPRAHIAAETADPLRGQPGPGSRGHVRLIESQPEQDAGLPVPDYARQPVAALRARLRGLDATQVTALLEFERGHEARADVMTMFERRIAKLEAAERGGAAG